MHLSVDSGSCKLLRPRVTGKGLTNIDACKNCTTTVGNAAAIKFGFHREEAVEAGVHRTSAEGDKKLISMSTGCSSSIYNDAPDTATEPAIDIDKAHVESDDLLTERAVVARAVGLEIKV